MSYHGVLAGMSAGLRVSFNQNAGNELPTAELEVQSVHEKGNRVEVMLTEIGNTIPDYAVYMDAPDEEISLNEIDENGEDYYAEVTSPTVKTVGFSGSHRLPPPHGFKSGVPSYLPSFTCYHG